MRAAEGERRALRPAANEIGIRITLGAPAGRVIRMLAGDGLRPVAIGIAGGLLIAVAATRLIQSMLFGVTHLDPTAYLIACGSLAAVGALASVLPARRAIQWTRRKLSGTPSGPGCRPRRTYSPRK